MASGIGGCLKNCENMLTHFPFTVLPLTSAIAAYIIEKRFYPSIHHLRLDSKELEQLNLQHNARLLARDFTFLYQTALAVSFLIFALLSSSGFAMPAALVFGISAAATALAGTIAHGIKLDIEDPAKEIKLLPAILG